MHFCRHVKIKTKKPLKAGEQQSGLPLQYLVMIKDSSLKGNKHGDKAEEERIRAQLVKMVEAI